MVHCNNDRASEIIVGDRSHINLWEQGSASHIGGVYVRQIKNLDDATFDLSELETMLTQFDESDPHCVITKLVCIEK
jgi:threonine aldolase